MCKRYSSTSIINEICSLNFFNVLFGNGNGFTFRYNVIDDRLLGRIFFQKI